jgi:hypothetical protein
MIDAILDTPHSRIGHMAYDKPETTHFVEIVVLAQNF